MAVTKRKEKETSKKTSDKTTSKKSVPVSDEVKKKHTGKSKATTLPEKNIKAKSAAEKGLTKKVSIITEKDRSAKEMKKQRKSAEGKVPAIKKEEKAKRKAKESTASVAKKAPATEMKKSTQARKKSDTKTVAKPDAKKAVKAKKEPKSVSPVGMKKAGVRTAASARKSIKTSSHSEEPTKTKRKYTRKSKLKTEDTVIAAKYQGKKGVPKTKTRDLQAPVKSVEKAKTFYSAKDIEYFREIILEKIRDANEELLSIEERLIDTATGEFNDEDSTYSLHMAEQGTDAMEREKAFLFAARERKFISHLSDALQRIKSGNYGVCIACGRLIEKGRLEVVPHARMCVTCKNKTKHE